MGRIGICDMMPSGADRRGGLHGRGGRNAAPGWCVAEE